MKTMKTKDKTKDKTNGQVQAIFLHIQSLGRDDLLHGVWLFLAGRAIPPSELDAFIDMLRGWPVALLQKLFITVHPVLKAEDKIALKQRLPFNEKTGGPAWQKLLSCKVGGSSGGGGDGA